jgi:ATP-binding cassette subfamily B (MDR/TAP) protein 1
LYIGIGIFACTFIYTFIWIHTGEKAARRYREAYLRAVLRQNMWVLSSFEITDWEKAGQTLTDGSLSSAYFDRVGPGEITTRITT